MLSRRELLRLAALGGTSALLRGAAFADEVLPPNLVLVMIDDLGAEALGCYGGTSYPTPRLDALAGVGLRFENAYACPTCIPSRATLMTSRYPFRTGFAGPHDPREDLVLDPGAGTFALALREAGYATGVAGKWQLARLDLNPQHPRECGFDESFLWLWSDGGPKAVDRYWDPVIADNGTLRRDFGARYGPDLQVEFLIDFMGRHRSRPFLAYYPMTLVHYPPLPTPDDGTRDLLDWSRRESLRTGVRMLGRSTLAMRLLGSSWFGGMVSYADKLIGRLLDAISELGLDSRTLVLVTADNGTPYSARSAWHGRTLPGGKDTLTELGTRVPLIAHWPGRVAPGIATDLTDLSDVGPTLLEIAGLSQDALGAVDGRSLAPRLLKGAPGPRSHVFAQRSERWFVRDHAWRLHQDGRLFDVRERYAENVAAPGPESDAARVRLARAAPLPLAEG